MKSETTALVVDSVKEDGKNQGKISVLWKSMGILFCSLLVSVIGTAIFPITVLLPTIIVFLFCLNTIVALSLFIPKAIDNDEYGLTSWIVAIICISMAGIYFSHDVAYCVSHWIRDTAIATPHALKEFFIFLYSVVCSFLHHAFLGSAQ